MKIKVLLLLSCFLLSGCFIQSLNKCYTDDLKIELPQISGEWISLIQQGNDVSDKNILPWKFPKYERNSDSGDTIETYDSNNEYSELDVAYFKIGDNIFMDFTAGNPSRQNASMGNAFWWYGVTRTHSVCKIIFANDNLIIMPLNYKWFEDKIKKKTMNLSFIQADKDSYRIFTATAEQWVSFLKTYGSDKDLFSEEYKFVFKKIKCNKGGTQLELNACASDDFAKAEEELNQTYQSLIKKEADGTLFISKLLFAQKTWLAFRDADLNARFACSKDDARICWGSMYPMSFLSRKAALTRERTKHLKQILKDGRGE